MNEQEAVRRESSVPASPEQRLERSVTGSLMQLVAQNGETVLKGAEMALGAYAVNKMVNRPHKDPPPKIELPPGVEK